MKKLDPNATVEVKLGEVTFRYKVLSVREWLAKNELRKTDEAGEVAWGALADSAAYGLVAIEGADVPLTPDGLMENLAIGELVELARESSNACALIGAEKKASDSPA